MSKVENADAGEDEASNTSKTKNDDTEKDGVSNTRGNSAPLQMFLIIALVVIVIFFVNNANTPTASIMPPPTYTQLPTYTPLPTNTPRPTYTQLPTNTPLPTATPTYTPSSTPTPTNTPTPTSIPPRVIIEYIQPMGQLVVSSVEVARADIHIAVDDGRWCSHDADYVAQGAIEAGIDFEALDEDNVSYDWATDSYTLHLPAPGLTSCRIEYIRQYANSFSVCKPGLGPGSHTCPL